MGPKSGTCHDYLLTSLFLVIYYRAKYRDYYFFLVFLFFFGDSQWFLRDSGNASCEAPVSRATSGSGSSVVAGASWGRTWHQKLEKKDKNICETWRNVEKIENVKRSTAIREDCDLDNDGHCRSISPISTVR